MLLRRFIVDKDKGRKLERKWEGPYIVERVGSSGVSVVLHDFMTDKCKGVLPGVLKDVGTKLFTIPVSNPSSVIGIASVQGKEGGMEQWDEFLDEIVHAINTRVLKVHSFSPSQLCIGFNVRLHSMGESVVESMRSHQLQQNIALYTVRKM